MLYALNDIKFKAHDLHAGISNICLYQKYTLNYMKFKVDGCPGNHINALH
jgi:hypothetical protein